MENPEQAKLMLHPTDTETGIQYRLLPMTRSMIGELLTPEQAEAHYAHYQGTAVLPGWRPSDESSGAICSAV